MKVTLGKTPTWKLTMCPGVMVRFDRGECLFSCLPWRWKIQRKVTPKGKSRVIQKWSKPLSLLDTFSFLVPIKQQYSFQRSPSLLLLHTSPQHTKATHQYASLLFHKATFDSTRETWSISSMTTWLREQRPRAGGHQSFAAPSCW